MLDPQFLPYTWNCFLALEGAARVAFLGHIPICLCWAREKRHPSRAWTGRALPALQVEVGSEHRADWTVIPLEEHWNGVRSTQESEMLHKELIESSFLYRSHPSVQCARCVSRLWHHYVEQVHELFLRVCLDERAKHSSLHRIIACLSQMK